MLKIDQDSFQFLAYTASNEPLYIYLLIDFEGQMTLASKQKVSKEQIDEAVLECYQQELDWCRKASDLDREFGGCVWELNAEDQLKYEAEQKARGLEGPIPNLRDFLGHKYGMYKLKPEVETCQRPEDWGEIHNRFMREEMEKDDATRRTTSQDNG